MTRERVSVSEAGQLIADCGRPRPAVRLPLMECAGRVLREDVRADRDQPPFHRVAMDGIAIASGAWSEGLREFTIEGTHHAGEPEPALRERDGCFEVMTGAVLPRGCDCVIPVEDIAVRDGRARVGEGVAAGSMLNVHEAGSDRRAGDVLLRAGQRLESPHIAVAASVGGAHLLVDCPPRIAVISTGDELVDVQDPVQSHQIRRSNVYAVEAGLHRAGYTDTRRHHIPDRRETVTSMLAEILGASDILMLSGGVSAGQRDFVPGVLDELGVRQIFHRVRQRPGQPFWFGVGPAGQIVYAMPGNPVSTLVCFVRYALPQLAADAGRPPTPEYALLSEDVEFGKPLTVFMPVSLTRNEDATLVAEPRPTNGSGDFSGLAETDGFIELPAGRERFHKGEAQRLYRWV